MRDFPCTVFPWTDYPYAGFPYTDFPCANIAHTEQPKNNSFALWAAFPYVGISEYGKTFKSRSQRKKTPKIDPYPDSKSSHLSLLQSKSRLPYKPIRSALWQTVYFSKSCCPSRLIDWYLIRLLLDSLVFLYLVFNCAGFSPCGFSMCGFATSGLSMCGYSPCGGTEKHLICPLSGVSLCGNIGIWHGVQKPLTAKENTQNRPLSWQ